MFIEVTQIVGDRSDGDTLPNIVNMDTVQRIVDLGDDGCELVFVSGQDIQVKDTLRQIWDKGDLSNM